MEKVFTFSVCLLAILASAEACYVPSYLYVPVPPTILPGYEITKVRVTDCDSATVQLTVTDPDFAIKTNGAVVALGAVFVGTRGRTFYVRAQDSSGPGSEMEVHLAHRAQQSKNQGFLKRAKRRWSPPPFNILENDKGPYPKDIEKVVSDSSAKYDVYYTISGPGFDEEPVGVFSLDRESGMLTAHKAVDREVYPTFTLLTNVFDRKTNQPTDLPLDIRIFVDDVNDNAPQFSLPLQFTVLESSSLGTQVGKVNATDRDQENTSHVKIRYYLMTGTDRFAIHPETGVISTVTNTLDRETQDKHLVTVVIKDLDGKAGALSNTATATITVGDINDNPPTFAKKTYTATVKENESEKLLLRIPVDDKDLINTTNWISKFEISRGNENGNFRIASDPKTNEALVYVAKPLNFEQNKIVNLEITAKNQAELSDSRAKWNSVALDVTVTDVDEGPEFSAPTVRYNVKENTPNGTLIGTYVASDPETKSSAGIMYYKLTDLAGWINVDRNTGELKVANTIDRESDFVKDGLYNVTVKAVDPSSKSATGTVIIQVEDVNDNVPVLPTGELVICEKEGEFGSVLAVAEDKDDSPFSSPFSFSLPRDNDGRWTVNRVNATAGILKQAKELPRGIYNVPVDITDLQGSGKTQTATVRICECRNGVCLAKDRSAEMGGLAWLTMLLPLLLLLLLFLLLSFLCVNKRAQWEIEDTADSGGILLKSNTEGKGDEVDASLINVPGYGVDEITKGSVKDFAVNAGYQGIKGTSNFDGQNVQDNWMHKSGVDMQGYNTTGQYDQYHGTFGSQYGGQLVNSGVDFESRQLNQDASHLKNWQTNSRYLQQKLAYMREEADRHYADDIVHAYGFEGVGSAAGSVGCCSDYGDAGNLNFLNTLGPKFKRLSDVCKKT